MLDGESIARGDESCEVELKIMPGQLHVGGRTNDGVSPAFTDTWATIRMTVADEVRHSWRVK